MHQTAPHYPTFGPIVALFALVATLLAVPSSPIVAQARVEAVALPALSVTAYDLRQAA